MAAEKKMRLLCECLGDIEHTVLKDRRVLYDLLYNVMTNIKVGVKSQMVQ